MPYFPTTSERRPRRRQGCHLWPAILAGALTGCAGSNVQLVSYKDPYFPERVHVALPTCVYRTDAGGNIHAVGCSGPQSASDAATAYLYVHIFWRPRPGKTPAESSTTDAVLHYAVATAGGAATYTGTGFAYPKQTLGGGLEIAIESGRLRLESKRGELPDAIGVARIAGTLKAKHDPAAASDLIRQIDLLAAR